MAMARESAARDSASYVSEGDHIILWQGSPIHTLAWMAATYYAKEVIRSPIHTLAWMAATYYAKDVIRESDTYSGMDLRNKLCKGSHPQYTLARESSATYSGKSV